MQVCLSEMTKEEDIMLTDSSEPDRVSRALREIVWQFGPKGLDGQCCQDLSMPEYLANESRIYREKLEAVLDKTPEGKSDNIRNAIVSMAEVLRR